MQVSTFYEKLNKVDGNTYVVEEEIHLTNGVYESELQHDNINEATFAVFTGPKLTGERLETYTLSTPSLAPWKRIVRVYADVPVVYISYETDGDTVDGDDINRVQDSIVATQEALNTEESRALDAEQKLANDLQAESNRAAREENRLDGRINTEAERAQEAEQVNRVAIKAESDRAKAAEKANADTINTESNRAQAAERVLQENIDGHTDAVNLEIQSLRAADTVLEEKKANADDVNRELGNRYTKDQVYTKVEVLKKIEDLIGAAPDTLDTFREIADALGNDPNFAATIMTALGGKVDKIAGKQLSSNDYTDEERAELADVSSKKHTHGNKSVLDKLTEILLNNWTDAYNKRHEHGNKTVIDKITQAMLDKLAGIAEGANKYVHPTTAGNKHIPSGGASGQVLKWSADGTAEWGAGSDSDTKVTQTNTTGSADYRMVLSGNANDSTETNTARKSANFLANPATGELYAKGFRRTDITGQTLDINTLNLSSGAPCIMRYIEKTNGGAANITNIPAAGQPFLLDVELIRWASATDYITMQTFRNAANPANEYVRYCKNGAWDDWTTRVFSDTKYSHPSSGVTAGTYRSVTVNAQGHVTAGTNPTTLAAYGITDAAAKNHNHDSTYLKKGAVAWGDLKGV